MRSPSALILLLALRCAVSFAAGPPIVGIDHIPFAVRDLARAQAAFRDLGFAIEPGRVHENGLRTAKVAFPDGSGIELTTTPAAVDPLTSQYVRLLDQGEGPAFLVLHVRDLAKLSPILPPGLEWLVIVDDNRAPTDRPAPPGHPNGATAMSRVWLAPDDPAPLRRVLLALGATIVQAKVAAPDPVDAEVAHLNNGELLILPPDAQLIPGRPIVGATFTASRILAPTRVMGMWVEFRQPPK